MRCRWLAGALLAFVPSHVEVASLAAFIALLAFGYEAFHTIATVPVFLHAEPIVTVAACVMIIGATTPGLFSRSLSWIPLVLLGRISYSLYLWHYPLLILLPGRPVTALVLALAVAIASYRLIETPLRARASRVGSAGGGAPKYEAPDESLAIRRRLWPTETAPASRC